MNRVTICDIKGSVTYLELRGTVPQIARYTRMEHKPGSCIKGQFQVSAVGVLRYSNLVNEIFFLLNLYGFRAAPRGPHRENYTKKGRAEKIS